MRLLIFIILSSLVTILTSCSDNKTPASTKTKTATPPATTGTKTVTPPTATETKTATPPATTGTKTVTPPATTETKTVTPPATTATKTITPQATTETKTETSPTGSPVITVYKSPTCSCCSRWITHLEKNGFKVIAHDVDDVTPYKIKAGLSPKLSSCHTGFINGYAIEGHVPAQDIKRLLVEKPKVKGLSVPGMPIGTPGMEMGTKKDPYDVISFDKEGKTKVFSKY